MLVWAYFIFLSHDQHVCCFLERKIFKNWKFKAGITAFCKRSPKISEPSVQNRNGTKDSLTAVVKPVQLEQVAVAELHALADDVAEGGNLGDDGGLGAVLEGSLAVVHHGTVVIRYVQGAWSRVVVFIEIVLPAWRTNMWLMCWMEDRITHQSLLYSSTRIVVFIVEMTSCKYVHSEYRVDLNTASQWRCRTKHNEVLQY